VQYGLDADQLKEVYPELVYEDANGNVSINYVEMVPLLVQSIKELSARVAELEGTSPRTAKAPTDATAIEETVADVDMVRMDQNKPNPFSESTVITLNIPSNTQVANIFIYDMSGKQVQSLPVSERGETNITVYASDLAAGMYIYTLVVDGKISVTRRMIVTKA
jgi:myo-inositol-hexaphosphate 3-phosphohydrolase